MKTAQQLASWDQPGWAFEHHSREAHKRAVSGIEQARRMLLAGHPKAPSLRLAIRAFKRAERNLSAAMTYSQRAIA